MFHSPPISESNLDPRQPLPVDFPDLKRTVALDQARDQAPCFGGKQFSCVVGDANDPEKVTDAQGWVTVGTLLASGS